MKTKCPAAVDIRKLVLNYGNLSSKEKEDILKHVETCRSCLDVYNMNVWIRDQTQDALMDYKMGKFSYPKERKPKMEYFDIACKVCKKKVSETYPPSLAMIDVNKDEDGENPCFSFLISDLCTNCYTKYKEEFNKVKSDREGWKKLRDRIIKEISSGLLKWNIVDVHGFSDNLYGSGAPCIFLVVDQPEKKKKGVKKTPKKKGKRNEKTTSK